jgi:signal recognition particle subunit SEC65
MTLPKNKKIEQEHIESMKLAVEEAGIRAIHPDKMEEFAEYLVQQARTQE